MSAAKSSLPGRGLSHTRTKLRHVDNGNLTEVAVTCKGWTNGASPRPFTVMAAYDLSILYIKDVTEAG